MSYWVTLAHSVHYFPDAVHKRACPDKTMPICNVQVHTVGSVSHEKESEAGERLIKGFKSVAQLDRWQQNKGADFVFFDPHPGFTDGKSDLEFKRYTCDVMRHSMHIVAERGQRNICKVRPC